MGKRLANRERPISQTVGDLVHVQRRWTGPSECNVMYAKTAYPDRELRSSREGNGLWKDRVKGLPWFWLIIEKVNVSKQREGCSKKENPSHLWLV